MKQKRAGHNLKNSVAQTTSDVGCSSVLLGFVLFSRILVFCAVRKIKLALLSAFERT